MTLLMPKRDYRPVSAFTLGYTDVLSDRFDQRGQGVPCGASWISRAKKCSKEKASQTPKEAKQRGVEKARDRLKLKRQIKAERPSAKAIADETKRVKSLSPSEQKALRERFLKSNTSEAKSARQQIERVAKASAEQNGTSVESERRNLQQQAGIPAKAIAKFSLVKQARERLAVKSHKPTVESTRKRLIDQRNREIKSQLDNDPTLAKVVEHYRGPKVSDRKFLQSSGLSRDEAQQAFNKVRQTLGLEPGQDPRKVIRDMYGPRKRKTRKRDSSSFDQGYDVAMSG
ncbi:MAG: hypothetical protein AAGB19_17630 [Cyanobacteria bacterium P01_F01_bin.3]